MTCIYQYIVTLEDTQHFTTNDPYSQQPGVASLPSGFHSGDAPDLVRPPAVDLAPEDLDEEGEGGKFREEKKNERMEPNQSPRIVGNGTFPPPFNLPAMQEQFECTC
ncbi:hypothetical protein CEXT_333881 [Caerostris extrusa]|uniref:Uncharacterized protein n=1 Tax=Caerostris extrusa TaxID=172846 RepID=A0AAV4TQR2_CAEEX|nr:hypothetical protein CEXT_333881 [Caerostris extrusa]